MKKYLNIILLTFTLFLFTTCKDDSIEDIKDIKVNTVKLVLDIGGSKDITITDGNGNYVVTSNNKNVITTIKSNTVNVKAVKEGVSEVSISDGKGKEIKVSVVVNKPIKSLIINTNKLTLTEGVSGNISITSGNGSYTVKSNTNVTVTIKNNTVIVKAVKAGTSQVTITDGKGKTVQFTVVVNKLISNLTINTNQLTLTEGDSGNIIINSGNGNYTVKSNVNVTVTIKNNTVTVKGVKEGTSQVTIADGKGKTVQFSVVVNKAVVNNNTKAEYEEIDNIVVIEAENISLLNSWTISKGKSGYSGTGYIHWGNEASHKKPGAGKIEVKIKINNPGTYLFQMRTKVGIGSKVTEHNDTWLRFSDADDFYGKEEASIVYPTGSGKTSPTKLNGESAEGWFKVYRSSKSTQQDWIWRTHTSDNDAHSIYVKFNKAGVYTMEISARSKGHLIDRIVLSKDTYPKNKEKNLSLPETPYK